MKIFYDTTKVLKGLEVRLSVLLLSGSKPDLTQLFGLDQLMQLSSLIRESISAHFT